MSSEEPTTPRRRGRRRGAPLTAAEEHERAQYARPARAAERPDPAEAAEPPAEPAGPPADHIGATWTQPASASSAADAAADAEPPPATDASAWTGTAPEEPRAGEAERAPEPPLISAWLQSPLAESWLQDAQWDYEETEGEDAWSTADSVRRFAVHSGSASSTIAPSRSAEGRLRPAETGITGTLDSWTSAPSAAAPEGPSHPAGSDPAPERSPRSSTGPVEAPTSADPAGAGSPSASQRTVIPRFRRELHGLRAFALLLVAVYHIWLGRVSGGVDVFLFLSAFFLTGTFIRRLDNGIPLAVPRYWLHTFKRLVPPAAVTIALTLLGTALLLPASLWPTVMDQAIASITYWQNYLLVAEAVDYQARDAGAASPLQHFWSLSVQGQVFLLWPLLFLLAVPVARRRGSVRGRMALVVSVVFAASLAWSIYSTAVQQPIAYFDTAARLWEFAAGSLLALAMPYVDRFLGARRPEEDAAPRFAPLRGLLGWAGILSLLACGIVLNVSGLFPGWIALWPITAAGLVIIAGHSGTRWGVDRLLSTRLFAFLGDISYALYLVHWPLLVMWLATSGQERAGLLDGLVVLAVSIAAAWLLTRLVDAPIRRSAWLRAGALRQSLAIAASLALVATASLGWRASLPRTDPAPPAAQTASAIDHREVPASVPATLHPVGYELEDQWPNLPYPCEGIYQPPQHLRGTQCQTALPADAAPERTIAIVGSSHSRQFAPALQSLAESRNWQVVNLHGDGCDFTVRAQRDACSDYVDWALEQLTRIDPDTVLLTASTTQPDGPREVLTEPQRTGIDVLLARGWDVVAVRDTPRWQEDMFLCTEAVLDAGGTPVEADAACGADASQKVAATDPLAVLEGRTGADAVTALRSAPLSGAGVLLPDAPPPGHGPALLDPEAASASVTTVDLTPWICPAGRCSPILGDVVVYMDDNHLTRSFTSEVLAEPLEEGLVG